MARITWLAGHEGAAACPVCDHRGPKPARLEMEHRDSVHRLLACPECGLHVFPELEPERYATWSDAEAVRGFELAFGLIAGVECLGRVDAGPDVRFLDVGCGTGFALDFAQHALGWEVLGVDAGAWSRAATAELGVPVIRALLGETDEIPAAAWDVVLANEVIEHVADPHAFVASLAGAAGEGGVVILCTPNAGHLSPERDPSLVRTMLSPGFHTMLHTRDSLERVLRGAGYGHVELLEDGPSLHAAASRRPFGWSADPAISDEVVVRYLRERAAALAPDAPARLGLYQQLAYRGLARGDLALAESALDAVDACLRERYGHVADPAAASLPVDGGHAFCFALVTRGQLALARGNRAVAAAAFGAAVRAGERRLDDLDATTYALELAVRHARRQEAVLGGDADRVARALEEAGPGRSEVAREILVQAVVSGSFELADRVADEAAADLDAGHRPDGWGDASWALGMVELLHRGAPEEAARRFAPMWQDDSLPWHLRWSSRFHEGYAWDQAGRPELATAPLQDVVTGASALHPPQPEDLARAREILARLRAAHDQGEAAVPQPATKAATTTRLARWLRRS